MLSHKMLRIKVFGKIKIFLDKISKAHFLHLALCVKNPFIWLRFNLGEMLVHAPGSFLKCVGTSGWQVEVSVFAPFF